jgi:glycosyltransferase involved in cell wall biosynthesis
MRRVARAGRGRREGGRFVSSIGRRVWDNVGVVTYAGTEPVTQPATPAISAAPMPTDPPRVDTSRARAVVVHNFYQQPGGEDQVFKDEVALLRGRGHHVQTFTVHNDEVAQLGRLSLARKTLWNRDAYQRMHELVRRERADVVHFHNTFPLVSPAAYHAAKDAGARVVQTLHNYRLLCPAATFYRDGHVCEDCLGRSVAWPGVLHKCYRQNRSASAMTAAMLAYHWMKGTWREVVDTYIALTEFSKRKFIEGGLPESKILVKPNFVDPDPGEGTGGGGYVVFIGRLTEEKGITSLLDAWKQTDLGARVRLKIVGDGPMRQAVESISGTRGIDYLGRQAPAQVYAILHSADALIFPSVWYEGLPRTIVEAFAKGTPVIASRLGSMAELVRPGENGELYEPGAAADLARCVGETLSNPTVLSDLRRGARADFLRCYTAETNYPMLLSAYGRAGGSA